MPEKYIRVSLTKTEKEIITEHIGRYITLITHDNHANLDDMFYSIESDLQDAYDMGIDDTKLKYNIETDD